MQAAERERGGSQREMKGESNRSSSETEQGGSGGKGKVERE